ncbi:MAG: protein kinase [Planctomycetaceae bacterium]|nr:protein kinase [Planctomycetaceae bacterium]
MLKVDQRERWMIGQRIPVEAYLEERPSLRENAETLLDLVYGEMLLRDEMGEESSLEDAMRRFPELAEDLKSRVDLFKTKITKPTDTVATRVGTATTHLDIAATHADTGPTTGPRAYVGPAAPARDPTWPMVDNYEIHGVLGHGGMGVVYRAYDRKRGTMVALKTVIGANPTALYHFKQEFRTLLDLSHPNLVNLYELISDGQNWFFTMELIDGVNFQEYVRSGFARPHEDLIGDAGPDVHPSRVPGERDPAGRGGLGIPSSAPALDPRPAAATAVQRERLREVLRQLSRGLVALHAAEKLHRDIKPTNVMVTRQGRVVLLDFGLAVELEHGERDPSTEGSVVGTVSYMAPEQAASMTVSPASDWYSVGVMLFEALTGRLPFTGKPLKVLMDKQMYDPPAPRTLVPDVPEDLDALCVELLRREPEARPSGRDVLRRLGDATTEPGSQLSRLSSRESSPLIGRERHRAVLADAYAAMTRGRTVLICVHGRSGAGKSLLVQRYLDDLGKREEAVVLSGRCYERETVPYKALDSLVDALSRYLRHLPVLEARALLPRDIQPLARIFPVLRRVEAVSEIPRRAQEIPDPQELRRRAFTALRDLLARLGDRQPLVLALDDLQWGDVDSAALLSELLRPPDPPVLLLIACYRVEDVETSPFLSVLLKPKGLIDASLDRRELSVEALSPAESRDLALALLDRGDPGAATQAEAIARESGGNPFFIAELVRSLQAGAGASERPASGAAITLDEVLWDRILRLPDEARRLLEVVAVSGRPVRQSEACQSAELAGDERAALALLRSARLVRGTGPAEGGAIETYHDRIRETVVAHLAPDLLQTLHHRLGLALEASGQADPEDLGTHFLAADEPEKAGEYFARAADQAAEALAFDRAVKLYRLALELRPRPGVEDRSLRRKLGDALANAGRGAEAAREYLTAAAGATVAEAFELRRRAAMQYLISGHIDEGLAALRSVLEAVGMTLPPTPRRALVSLLLRRALLRLRGLGFRPRDTSEVAPADLTRIDVCWSAIAGLSVVDTIRGADFQARCLILALRAGEPFRISRALAMEAAHAASVGGPNRRHTLRLLDLAQEMAERDALPYALGMVTGARGTADYLVGLWKSARRYCEQAEAIFRDRCTGVAWELDTVHAFGLWALSHLGETAELSRRWPLLLKEARERGDLYAVMNLSTYLMSIVRLAAGAPDEARDELRRTMAKWSQEGYHVQHNDALWGALMVELYRGDGLAAWDLLERSWPALSRSMLLRVQFIRISMWSLRGRSALAAASTAADPRPYLRQAGRDARRLERERLPYAEASAALIRAGLLAARGDLAGAATRLADAADRFDAADMRLCAQAARRRLGLLLGGDEGRDLVTRADAWMAGEKILDPVRMTAVYAPEFPRPG